MKGNNVKCVLLEDMLCALWTGAATPVGVGIPATINEILMTILGSFSMYLPDLVTIFHNNLE